jgi:putative DNA primase/helicase
MVMAGSVWGKGDNFVGTWRATGNGLEGVAVSHNDTCMILDEISESSSKDVGSIVYAIANGHGKLRANRSGFARTPQHWRLLMLSSGERGLAAHMAESGASIKAGQEVRLPDVPVTRTHGVFDNLHGHQNGSEFSDYLKWTANKYYGHAGPKFIEQLIDSPERGQLRAMHEKLHSTFDTDGGQEKRTADRFAVSALAGELAIQFGLLPLKEGAAVAAARVLFNAWKENRGAGDSEPRQILRAVSDFVSRHSESRFSSLSSEERHNVRDRAGWWKDKDGHRLYLFTNEGLKDATKGHDFRRAKQALDAAGWIAERDGNRFDKATWILGRTQRLFYVTILEVQE